MRIFQLKPCWRPPPKLKKEHLFCITFLLPSFLNFLPILGFVPTSRAITNPNESDTTELNPGPLITCHSVHRILPDAPQRITPLCSLSPGSKEELIYRSVLICNMLHLLTKQEEECTDCQEHLYLKVSAWHRAYKATTRHERQGRNDQYNMKMNTIEGKLMWGKQKEQREKKIKHSLKKRKKKKIWIPGS